MASQSNQYIFGEFSPDEFNQFFVTPRCYVELPPFNDKVSCISHSSGEDYQHIEFGVDEVINAEPVAVRDSLYKVSSTLNPQAPEFILGCQPSQKAFPTATPVADIPDGADFNSLCCDDSETSVHQSCSDMDGVSGGLGQRKKKKKRPPGYYNYLEGSNSTGMATDGVGASGLVNGHTLNASLLGSEDMMGDMLAEAELIPPNSVTSTAQTAPLSLQRTCESPDNSTLDLTSGAASLADRNGAASLSTSSSSSSQSSGVAQVGRTAEQHAEPPALESPVLLGNGGHSSSPPSPLPPAAALATPTTTIPATTDQREAEGSGEANGLPETASAAGAADELQDSSEIGEVQSSSSVTPLSLDSEVQPVVSPVPPAAPVANPPKSWASLFHNSKPLPGGPQAYVEVKSVPAAVVEITPAASELPEKANEVHEGPVPVSEDPMAPKLAELIENVKLIHKPVSLQPRGLINKGNWCYINATLQALIACPPMYHLMKSIPLFSETQRPCTSTPMMDNFVRLVNEFSNMPVPSKAKQQAAGEKIMKDLRVGVAFEPTYIYKLLTLIKSSLSEKGRQEDAEEYLGFILNGLHEEMLALKRLISPQEDKAPTPNGPESQPGVEEDPAEKEEGSDDEWEQVGPRNKTSITRQADFIRTPITDIFGGHIRGKKKFIEHPGAAHDAGSVVYQQSSKESATLQPFFTLQLDIQSEKIRTVQEALEILVARESVQGYTTKSKQEIEISRRVTLEELPPVLVLHLKRFVFEKTGGCQKLVKNIDYPVDLEISKDLLSPGVRGKTFKGQRTYRLFAVVYHHGNSATGGHYTTDVFHIGLNGWLRIDDQTVKIINQHQVVKQTAERTAYLLYYRRLDLL
ncbi:ubiquitin carboxyl-terminal hydrolase 10 isoform X3 [Pimephales promelas]|uniref:ubiquitin carboxyl-terminal hydrolase 10 isoform X3 n=1 Tax=Pimephales promelas TaxID=90988 RepID=UPI0019554D93|nr:ubiquitin carboxyl-terminal hydrolase 10 isoform X3 [Pimephales promelas]KAG1952557.1 ubiquitin carboxyl-terminal hydrolase [Pimephales promelas]